MPEFDGFQYGLISLPEAELLEKDPITIEKSLDSWPDHRIAVGLGYNNASTEWHFAVYLNDFGWIIPPSPVKLDLPYGYRDYIRFIFHDSTEQTNEITSKSLNNRIEFTVWPGPESPAYEPRVNDQPLLGETTEEPWREMIGYGSETEVVNEPLPAQDTYSYQ